MKIAKRSLIWLAGLVLMAPALVAQDTASGEEAVRQPQVAAQRQTRQNRQKMKAPLDQNGDGLCDRTGQPVRSQSGTQVQQKKRLRDGSSGACGLSGCPGRNGNGSGAFGSQSGKRGRGGTTGGGRRGRGGSF